MYYGIVQVVNPKFPRPIRSDRMQITSTRCHSGKYAALFFWNPKTFLHTDSKQKETKSDHNLSLCFLSLLAYSVGNVICVDFSSFTSEWQLLQQVN